MVAFSYVFIPLEPVVMDFISPLNESRRKVFAYYCEYFIDDQKYYWQLFVHGAVAVLTSVNVFCAFDPLYTQCVQHCCALFVVAE